jgi:glycoside/pentoside/hexuronide:cation symporter, GPH family
MQVPLGTKLSYGLGAAAYGIKDNGFSVFLLIFYNQVVGLPAGAVGAAIALALVFDAMIDPLLGVLSDRTNTRWGRRHPWLYASALPIALSWVMLWHPPQGSQSFILGYLTLTAVLARAAIATNEVPSLAMAPELTLDYDERTAVLRYRFLFGWIGGMTMLLLAYAVFLVPPIGGPTPAQATNGYQTMALFAAGTMAATVLISALGTHKRMAHVPRNPIAPQSVGQILAAMRQALGNRAFGVLMLAGIFGYTNQGVGFAMSQYNLTYVWQLSPIQFLIYSVSLIVGVVAIFLVISPIVRMLGKVRAASLLTVFGAVIVASPYILRLTGLMPPPGSVASLIMFLALNTTGTALGIGAMITAASMMSDVVEASQEHTGRREEGLFFAGALFMQKCASGLGILISGFILQAAQFPIGVAPAAVPSLAIDRISILFALATLTLSIVAAIVFRHFPFGKAEHDARLTRLAVAASAAGSERG